MAATVVGAFTVIDRASRPIRNIRDAANQADASVRRLGNSLDRIGTPAQLGAMRRTVTQLQSVRTSSGQAAANVRDLNDALRRTSAQNGRLQTLVNQLDQIQNRLNSVNSASNQTNNSVNRLNGSLGNMGNLLKVAIVPMIGLAAQGLGALAVGAAALLPDLSSLAALMAPLGAGITGMGVAMVTAKLATEGLGKAMSGNKEALKGLTPQARAFVRTLKQYAPILKDLKREAQQGLFPGLDLALRRIVRAAPVAESMLGKMGRTLGRIASSAARWATRGGFLRDLEMLSGQGGVLLQRGARILMNVGDALRHLFVAAMPFTDWLTKTVEGWSKSAKSMALVGRQGHGLSRWFRRARTDLEQFGRIGADVARAIGATLTELRPTSELIYDSIEKITGKWADWAQSANGRGDMRRYFAQMVPPLKQVALFAGDLGKALGTLAGGSGFTASMRALREAIPTLTTGLNAMAENVGPAVVGALSEIVRLFGIMSAHGGPLQTAFNFIGGIASGISKIMEVLPGLATALAAAFSVKILAGFGAMLATIMGRMRAIRSTPPVPPPVPPGGGPVPPPGPAGPGWWARNGQMAMMGGAIAANVAGAQIGGTAGGTLAMAGTGAMLGGMAGSVFPGVGTAIGAGVGALGGGAIGFFQGRGRDAKNAVQLGGDQALEFLAGGANAKQIGGRVTDIQGRLAEQQVLSTTPTGPMGQPGRTVTQDKVRGNERKRLETQLKALKPALEAQRKQERQEAVRAAQDSGQRIATALGQAFNIYDRRYGLNKSMKMLRGDTMRQLQGLGPVGRKAMGENVLMWAREQARQNPKMWGQVRRLTKRMEDQFESLGQKVRIVNGRILDGTREDWRRIGRALSDPAELALQRVSKAFTAMQNEAATALVMAGYTRAQANDMIRGRERGGVKEQRNVQTGISAMGGDTAASRAGGTDRKARGGRIAGTGLYDNVQVAPNVLAAPGELIVNRHTENRVNSKLAAFGTSLGSEVHRETRPHYAATGARVGAGDMRTSPNTNAGLKGSNAQFGPVMSTLQERFGPQLYVMSGARPGSRIAGSGRISNHASGNAIDISWPGLESAGPGRPPESLNKAGAAALDAVYSYLQTVPQPPRRDLLWRTMTGGNHYNHVHFGMDPGGTLAGASAVPFTGAGASGMAALKKRKTGVGGVAGAIGDSLLAAGVAALSSKIGATGGPSASGNAVPGGGGVLSFNQVASLAESAGLPGITFAQIAKGESGFNPRAVGHDPGGTQGLGLWQITTGFNDDVIARFGGRDAMFNPNTNAAAAKAIYDRQGIKAWYGTKYMTDPNAHYTGGAGMAMGGRMPDWGGWFGGGTNGPKRFNRPTMIGVGDTTEDVTITPARAGGGNRASGGGQVVLNIAPGAIVINGGGKGSKDVADEVMERLTVLVRNMGMEPEGAIS